MARGWLCCATRSGSNCGTPSPKWCGIPRWDTLPNTLMVSSPDVLGGAVLAATPGLAASTGSACQAGQDTPAATLLAMGFTPEVALGAVRLILGHSWNLTVGVGLLSC